MRRRGGGSNSAGLNSTSNQRRVAFDLSKNSVPLRRHNDMPLQVEEPPAGRIEGKRISVNRQGNRGLG